MINVYRGGADNRRIDSYSVQLENPLLKDPKLLDLG